jgi:uncharacterized protein (DUF433 family)
MFGRSGPPPGEFRPNIAWGWAGLGMAAVMFRYRFGGFAYTAAMEFERITVDPAKMRGVPCIRSLRIPVATVLGQLARKRSVEQILADFPDLEPEDIPAALEYAAAAVEERELPLAQPA